MRTCLFVSAITAFMSYLGADAIHTSNSGLSMHNADELVDPWAGSALCQVGSDCDFEGEKFLIEAAFGLVAGVFKGIYYVGRYAWEDLGAKNYVRGVHVYNPLKSFGLMDYKPYDLSDL